MARYVIRDKYRDYTEHTPLNSDHSNDGTHSVDEVPSIELIRTYEKLEKDPTFRWSMRIP